MLPKIKIKKNRRPKTIVPAPHRPTLNNKQEPEFLMGQIQGKRASAAEERFFGALNKNKNVIGAEFRYTLGAPRGLSGWFEIDALVSTRSMVYAIEIDSVFTHQDKKESDRLHDAKALNALDKLGMNVFPKVIHIDGELDLSDKKKAENKIRQLFG